MSSDILHGSNPGVEERNSRARLYGETVSTNGHRHRDEPAIEGQIKQFTAVVAQPDSRCRDQDDQQYVNAAMVGVVETQALPESEGRQEDRRPGRDDAAVRPTSVSTAA